jgi:hypothetical protein
MHADQVYHKAAMQRCHHLNVAREVALLTRLRALRTPGVVRLLGTSECAANIHLTFQACEGGDLYARIRDGSYCARGEAAVCQEVGALVGLQTGAAGSGGGWLGEGGLWTSKSTQNSIATRSPGRGPAPESVG